MAGVGLDESVLDALGLQADYRSRGALLDLVLALGALAGLELRLGRLVRARAAASEAVQLAEERHLDSPAVWALLRLAASEALLGQETDCRRHADDAIEYARETGHREIEVHALDALGRLHLGLGRSEQSILCFESVRQMAGNFGGGTGYVPWRPDLIEAYVRADRSAEALSELEAFERLAELSAWASAAIARCRALLADADALDDALRRGAGALHRLGLTVRARPHSASLRRAPPTAAPTRRSLPGSS